MNFLLFTILFFSFAAIVYILDKTSNKKITVIAMTFYLWFFMGFRHEIIGHDTIPYINFYKYVQETGFDVFNQPKILFEKGYIFLNYILSRISSFDYILIPISALLSLLPIGMFIYKYSQKPMVSFILFYSLWFYFFMCSAIRQSIAIGFSVVAFSFVIRKKYIWALLSILLACTFHSTAIIGLLLLLLPKLPVMPLVMFLISLTLLSLFNNIFFKTSLQPLIEFFHDDSIYFRTAIKGFNFASLCFLLQYTIIAIIGYVTLYKDKCSSNDLIAESERSEPDELMHKSLLVGCLLICFSITMTVLMRLSHYFVIYSIVLLPNCIERKKWRILYPLLIMVFLMVLLIIETYRNYWLGLFPYYTYWNNVPLDRYWLYKN